MITYAQVERISDALAVAGEFAAANNLTPSLTTYAEIREFANGSGSYGVFLFTQDPDGYAVTVRVEIDPDGGMSGARGFDAANAWVSA